MQAVTTLTAVELAQSVFSSANIQRNAATITPVEASRRHGSKMGGSGHWGFGECWQTSVDATEKVAEAKPPQQVFVVLLHAEVPASRDRRALNANSDRPHGTQPRTCGAATRTDIGDGEKELDNRVEAQGLVEHLV